VISDGPASPVSQVLLDFYRCPETLCDYLLDGELSLEAGFFSLGSITNCYGRFSSAPSTKAPPGSRIDLSQHVGANGTTPRLPFDPNQVITNLRQERYVANGSAGKHSLLSNAAIQRAYYFLRPLLGISVRKHLQRLFLRGWPDLAFPKWPVDTTVERLLERLLIISMKARNLQTVPFIWFWPEGAPSCAMVTHDLETQAGVAFAPRLMDVDDSFGIKTSFQVIPEGGYAVSQRFLNSIRARGFELNIQDLSHDGNLFNDHDEFIKRSRKINRYLHDYGAEGFRSGRMYRKADWYQFLDMSYDMSIPNVAHLDPQRGGCCSVFPYFIGRILEFPLTTSQDYSLFHILGDYSIGLWERQLELILAVNGLASFIIHPDYVREKRAMKVYLDLLKHLAKLRDEAKVWIALPGDINRWWRERNQMKLVWEDGEWRIQGRGNERARLAFASLVDDRIVYGLGKAGMPSRLG
jgi:hypothetical protein